MSSPQSLRSQQQEKLQIGGSIRSTSAKRSGGVGAVGEHRPSLCLTFTCHQNQHLCYYIFLYILHFQTGLSELILPERGI